MMNSNQNKNIIMTILLLLIPEMILEFHVWELMGNNSTQVSTSSWKVHALNSQESPTKFRGG